MSPAASATPAPMSATNVTPTTVKPVKLDTNDEKMNRRPSTDRRLWMAIVVSLMTKCVSSVKGMLATMGSTGPPTYSGGTPTGTGTAI